MNVLEDMMLVYRIAKNYYIDGYGQKEIAKMTGISRPQISRLIKKGQELGIVKIEVSLPDTVNVKDLERELAICLGIREAVVIPQKQTGNPQNFYLLAVEHVAECLDGCRNIGLGWGHTLYEMARALTYQTDRENVAFYPLIGCSGSTNPYLQVSSIVDRFAERYKGRACYLNLPAMIENEMYTASVEKKQNAFQKCWERLDAAVVGIGTLGIGDPVYIDEVSTDTYLLERIDKIAGDVLSHMLLKDGGELILPGYHHIACPINTLKNIPVVIGVARGVAKAEAIHRAAEEKCLTTLITDEETAKEIIKQYRDFS